MIHHLFACSLGDTDRTLLDGLAHQMGTRTHSSLESLAADFATLSGGFFCVDTSRRLWNWPGISSAWQPFSVIQACTTGVAYQVYNYIYAEHFNIANKLIRTVQAAVAAMVVDDVLIQMCRSARLFRKRVHKARQTPATGQTSSLMTDAFHILFLPPDYLALPIMYRGVYVGAMAWSTNQMLDSFLR
jgi:hypothetical protein